MEPLYPLRFSPVYKDYIWGGSRIPQRFHRDLPDGVYAESWEISTHPDGRTPIANGPLTGKTLSDLLPQHKKPLLGTGILGGDFPLLIKLIDARETLSVQVHPNDDNAALVDGQPKTEMWYFLEGDGSSHVYCGLKPGTGRDGFLQAIGEGTLTEILNPVPVVKGEAVYVPGGRVHAIGEGCLILEIQQNSNTTYRIYDWGRVDATGRGRDLHIEKALQVIDWDDSRDPVCKATGSEILTSPYFRLDRFSSNEEIPCTTDGKSFHALFIAEGKGTLSWGGGTESLHPGQSWLIPAALGRYTLHPGEGTLTWLCITVP